MNRTKLLITIIFSFFLPLFMDTTREMRAMILCALPYPPLPVIGSKFEDNKLGESTVISSHDIISHLLQVACVKNHNQENMDRMKKQQQTMNKLFQDLRQTLEPGKIYEIYCQQTAAHISSYYPTGEQPELRFMPIDYCCRGDYVHQMFAQYIVAQGILLQENSEINPKLVDFIPLLLLTRKRWVDYGQDFSLTASSCNSCDETSPSKDTP